MDSAPVCLGTPVETRSRGGRTRKRLKGQRLKRALYACYSHKSKSIKPNRIKFGGMIGYYPGTI